MKWNRIGVLMMAVLLVVLSACSGGATTPSNGGGNEATPTEATASTGGGSDSKTPEPPVKLTWFSSISFWNPPKTWSTDPKTVQGAITEKTGVTFEFDIPAQDGDTKLNLLLVSGNKMPDVITIANADLNKKLIEADKVWPLEEFLTKYDPDSHLLKQFPEDLKKVLIARDGGWYAYPSHISTEDARKVYPPSGEYYSDGNKYRSNSAIMVNKNILAEAGIELSEIETEDDLFAAYKKVKDKGIQVNGAPVIPLLVDGKTYHGSTLSTLQNFFGAMPVDKDGIYRDRLLAPETKYALEFLFKAAQGGYIDPSQMTMDTTGVQAEVLSGRVFTYIGNTANTKFSDQDFWVSPGPILSNKGTKPVLGMSSRATGGWMQTFISKSTAEPEKLAKWLSFMSSPEGLTLHYYGLEGEHFTYDANRLIVQTEEGLKAAEDFSTTGVFAFWPFHHISWHNHATRPPEEVKGNDGVQAMQVQSALGKSPHTVRYDSSVFQLPGDFIPAGSKMATDRIQIDTFKEAQIAKIVMAKNEAEFNKLYEELIAKVKQLGLTEIDAKINEQVQKQSEEFGITVKGVNS